MVIGGNLVSLSVLSFSRFCNRSVRFFITSVEAINTTSRVHQLLFSGEKRMAIRADFNVKLFLARRARGESIATRTLHFNVIILRVNSLFHNYYPL